MKYLILILFFLGVFGIIKSGLKLNRSKEVAKWRCVLVCPVEFFPQNQGKILKKGSQELFFCSDKCLKEYLLKEGERTCS